METEEYGDDREEESIENVDEGEMAPLLHDSTTHVKEK